jgi:DNA-binding NtrC family response regulator
MQKETMKAITRTARLLIVDDEEAALKTLARAMARDGHEIATATSGAEALSLLAAQPFDILLTDLRMEKVDGMQLLKACRERYPDIETVVITGYATAEAAVQAMKQGAFYFVAKPYRLSDVRRVLGEALEKVRLRAENASLRSQVDAFAGRVRIITQDAGMRQLLDVARQVAPTGCNVLIEGESGTGKELFARFLHHESGRANGPYVAVNCGAFNPDLLANELFGHEKEAFTGAAGGRKGLIEAASGGTLFLDEITEMTPDMQVKLLRVIQEREVMRLGATAPVPVNVRIVAATNRSPAEAVKSGVLRLDLYFRLNVVTLTIPLLRDRRGDIPLLVAHFVQKSAERMGKSPMAVSAGVMEALMDYDFPGNVRELENLVERGVALASGQIIELAQLPKELLQRLPFTGEAGARRIATLEEQERKYIRWVLAEAGGNQTTAARMLGIDRSSLWRKLKSYQSGK